MDVRPWGTDGRGPMGDGDYFDFRGSTFHGPVTGKVETGSGWGTPSTLPAAPAVFTGRDDDVAELLRGLNPGAGDDSDPVVISAVAGLGGVGKTALALYVAHAARERRWFPGGLLFIDLRGYDEVPATADQVVGALLRTLGVADADLPLAPYEQYGRYRSELASREPVLIVLDNAFDAAQIAPVLPDGGAGHRVLVTSRDALDSLPARQFRIEALDPGASHLLVERSLTLADPTDRRVSEEPDAIRELTELCGHLPLALLIAAALLRRRRRRPIATLTDELREATDRVRALRAKGVDQYGKELVLQSVFDTMYALLEPELARAFRLFGEAPGADFGLPSAACLLGVRQEVLPFLDDLTAASLLTAHTGRERWQMHDLVRLYARAVTRNDPELRAEAAEARQRLLTLYSLAVLSANGNLLPGYGGQDADSVPDVFAGDRAHALSWLDSERTGLLGATLWDGEGDQSQAQISMALGLTLGFYLNHRAAFGDAAAVAQAAAETAHRTGEADSEAESLNMLGFALRGLRRYEEAVDAFGRARDIYARLGSPSGESTSWVGLGIVHHALQQFDEATEAFTRGARLRGELGDQNLMAPVHSSMGLMLRDLGRLDESYDVLTQALDACLAAGDRYTEGTIRDHLGSTLREMGRHEDAVDAHTRAIGLLAEQGNWHDRSTAWNNLGVALRELGRYDEALTAHVRARDWFGTLGDLHREAMSWGNMNNVLRDLGRLEESLEAGRQAFALFTACGDRNMAERAQRNVTLTLAHQHARRNAHA
jgi:tetratricopeptide (TPR) repeat protein